MVLLYFYKRHLKTIILAIHAHVESVAKIKGYHPQRHKIRRPTEKRSPRCRRFINTIRCRLYINTIRNLRRNSWGKKSHLRRDTTRRTQPGDLLMYSHCRYIRHAAAVWHAHYVRFEGVRLLTVDVTFPHRRSVEHRRISSTSTLL